MNAEHTSTENYGNDKAARMSTENVRTAKDLVCSRSVLCTPTKPQTTVHYGPGLKRIVGACRCCACAYVTPECRKSGADFGSSRSLQQEDSLRLKIQNS